jgi:hypothetical protein
VPDPARLARAPLGRRFAPQVSSSSSLAPFHPHAQWPKRCSRRCFAKSHECDFDGRQLCQCSVCRWRAQISADRRFWTADSLRSDTRTGRSVTRIDAAPQPILVIGSPDVHKGSTVCMRTFHQSGGWLAAMCVAKAYQ